MTEIARQVDALVMAALEKIERWTVGAVETVRSDLLGQGITERQLSESLFRLEKAGRVSFAENPERSGSCDDLGATLEHSLLRILLTHAPHLVWDSNDKLFVTAIDDTPIDTVLDRAAALLGEDWISVKSAYQDLIDQGYIDRVAPFTVFLIPCTHARREYAADFIDKLPWLMDWQREEARHEQPFCAAMTTAAKPCRNRATKGDENCYRHSPAYTSPEAKAERARIQEEELEERRRCREEENLRWQEQRKQRRQPKSYPPRPATRAEWWAREGMMFLDGNVIEVLIRGGRNPVTAHWENVCSSCGRLIEEGDGVRQVNWTDAENEYWKAWVHDDCAMCTGSFIQVPLDVQYQPSLEAPQPSENSSTDDSAS